jgi:molybdopterin molybdotransferase
MAPMTREQSGGLTVAAALEMVLAQAAPLGAETVRLGDSRGRVLAEAINADLDLPPFDRVAMDGYAVRSQDAAAAVALEVVGQVKAGQWGGPRVGPGQAVEVMTGAPLPEGADAVIPVERTTRREGGRVELGGAVRAGQHVAARASRRTTAPRLRSSTRRTP